MNLKMKQKSPSLDKSCHWVPSIHKKNLSQFGGRGGPQNPKTPKPHAFLSNEFRLNISDIFKLIIAVNDFGFRYTHLFVFQAHLSQQEQLIYSSVASISAFV